MGIKFTPDKTKGAGMDSRMRHKSREKEIKRNGKVQKIKQNK